MFIANAPAALIFVSRVAADDKDNCIGLLGGDALKL